MDWVHDSSRAITAIKEVQITLLGINTDICTLLILIFDDDYCIAIQWTVSSKSSNLSSNWLNIIHMHPIVLYIHVKTVLLFHNETKIIICKKWKQNGLMEGKTNFCLVWSDCVVLFAAQCILSPLSSLKMAGRKETREFTGIEER